MSAQVNCSLLSVACIVAAVLMIIYDKEGWGWFIFLAFLFA